MPLIVYDKATGKISQCLLQAQIGLDVIQKVHEAAGEGTLMVAEFVNPIAAYIANAVVTARPDVAIYADDKQWKADGQDVLTLSFEPACRVEVWFQGVKIAEQTDVSEIPLQTSHPGEYMVKADPPWPYLEQTQTIKAV